MCIDLPAGCALCACLVLTAQVLQDEIQLPSGLEGVDEINYEGVLHLLQDVPLCLGMGRVLGVAYNHRLVRRRSTSVLVKSRGRRKEGEVSFMLT